MYTNNWLITRFFKPLAPVLPKSHLADFFSTFLSIYSFSYSLKWCPSIKKDNEDCRLGILAVATSQGCVQLLVIGKDMFKSDDIKYFNAKVCKMLKRQDYFGDCLSLSWYRGKYHRILAGTFMVSFF